MVAAAAADRETGFAGPPYGAPAEPSWRDVDWSRHIRRAELDGAAVEYVDLGSGEGPPVVFVHGLGGTWRNWLENLPAVAGHRRVVALDLPGFGNSDMPAEDVSIPAYADLVDRLCEHLGLGPVAVVGTSMGGFVAAELAITHPERVDRLVLVGAAGIVPTRGERFKVLPILRATGLLSARAAAAKHHIAGRPRLRRLALRVVASQPERLRADLVYHGLIGPSPPAFRHALEAALSYASQDWTDRLASVRSPTLLVWGDGDAILPVRHCREFERRVPQARAIVWPETGHIPMVERPGPFNEALLEFIGEQGGSGAAPAKPARVRSAH